VSDIEMINVTPVPSLFSSASTYPTFFTTFTASCFSVIKINAYKSATSLYSMRGVKGGVRGTHLPHKGNDKNFNADSQKAGSPTQLPINDRQILVSVKRSEN
jgi:hypothetical protein